MTKTLSELSRRGDQVNTNNINNVKNVQIIGNEQQFGNNKDGHQYRNGNGLGCNNSIQVGDFDDYESEGEDNQDEDDDLDYFSDTDVQSATISVASIGLHRSTQPVLTRLSPSPSPTPSLSFSPRSDAFPSPELTHLTSITPSSSMPDHHSISSPLLSPTSPSFESRAYSLSASASASSTTTASGLMPPTSPRRVSKSIRRARSSLDSPTSTRSPNRNSHNSGIDSTLSSPSPSPRKQSFQEYGNTSPTMSLSSRRKSKNKVTSPSSPSSTTTTSPSPPVPKLHIDKLPPLPPTIPSSMVNHTTGSNDSKLFDLVSSPSLHDLSSITPSTSTTTTTATATPTAEIAAPIINEGEISDASETSTTATSLTTASFSTAATTNSFRGQSTSSNNKKDSSSSLLKSKTHHLGDLCSAQSEIHSLIKANQAEFFREIALVRSTITSLEHRIRDLSSNS